MTPLSTRIATKIMTMIETGQLAAGEHLSVLSLTKVFDVSRSPIHEALRHLEEKNVLFQQKNRGFFVNPDFDASQDKAVRYEDEENFPQEYYTIAEDWLQDRIEAEVNEQYLQRRYGLSKPQLSVILGRATSEGWAERKQGYGWRFLPVAKNPTALSQMFRVRMALEPMALLEPTFYAPREKLQEIRNELEKMISCDIERLSPIELQMCGYRFHETIIGFSNNPFFDIALRNLNRMRRLLDYRIMGARGRYYDEVRAHLALLDLIEAGKMVEASFMMKQHLAQALENKHRVAREQEAKLTHQAGAE